MGFWQKLFSAKQREDKAKLRCQVCGHIQREGDWKEAMDAQMRAMGARSFIIIGVEPQCLKCGSRELRDLSRPISAEEEEPKFVTDAAEEILRIMEPYFRYNADLGKAKERLVAIGKSLYDNGGHAAMLAAFKKARNLAHRRFGYTGSNRLLEVIWDGIGEWLG